MKQLIVDSMQVKDFFPLQCKKLLKTCQTNLPAGLFQERCECFNIYPQGKSQLYLLILSLKQAYLCFSQFTVSQEAPQRPFLSSLSVALINWIGQLTVVK